MPCTKLTTAQVKIILSFRLKYNSCRTWSFFSSFAAPLIISLHFIILCFFASFFCLSIAVQIIRTVLSSYFCCFCCVYNHCNLISMPARIANKSPVRNILSICLRPLFHSFVHLYNFSKRNCLYVWSICRFFYLYFIFRFFLLIQRTKIRNKLILTIGVVQINTNTKQLCTDTHTKCIFQWLMFAH